jgi:alkanesulfonate monooxygenase SsuD/methylene tetrahydromethanopterin reductase-like flavin-dependent oxidoreductase (luciferase family)
LWARSRVKDGRALLQEGESRSEQSTHTRISLGVPVALGADEHSARQLAAWWLSTYLARMGPIYPRMLSERFAMTAGVNAIVDATHDHKSELPAAAEDLAHEITLIGTYDQAEEAIAAWFAAGADDVNLVLPPNRPEHELAETMQVAAAATAAARQHLDAKK